MTPFTLDDQVWIPLTREQIFPFFADARNLEAITPPWVSFKILTPGPILMKPGTLIDYQIRIHGIPIRWRTEITEWNPPFHFVDCQVRGPYRLWKHTHSFESKDGGTLCKDHVDYWPIGGGLINRLFVRSDVERIFAYRKSRLLELLSTSQTMVAPSPP